MTPPLLPPGHFAGDGHNHGVSVGDGHDHGHVHSVNESPAEHLDHMQEHQRTEGRATLEEFHNAARETAQLRSGQRAETSRQPESRAAPQSGRETAGPRSEPRESALLRGQGQGPRGENVNSGTARFFSPQAANNLSWTRVLQNFLPPQRPPSQAAKDAPVNPREGAAISGHSASYGGGRTPDGKASSPRTEAREELAAEHSLQRLQETLQQALKQPGAQTGSLKLNAVLAEAIGGLVQEAMQNPELLQSLPPQLRALVASLAGESPKELAALMILLGTSSAGKGMEVLLGLQLLANLSGAGMRGLPAGKESAIQGLGLMLAPMGFNAPLLPRFNPGLLQRLEKSLMGFLSLLFAKPGKKTGETEDTARDELLLQQLATLLAAKEKKRRPKPKVKKKGEFRETVVSKQDSDFSDEARETEDFSSEEVAASCDGIGA
ncbi:MAG: hypothetical protein K8R69_11575 [Deltaproteobacteria bacterium]|nr:hypothetical protein [Deltaproteobacteria bacterium]